MYGNPDPASLDELVRLTAETFFTREQEIRAASDAEILERYPGSPTPDRPPTRGRAQGS
jgi:hypothetical protein